MKVVKGVTMVDNRGAQVVVNGVLSKDETYVAACICRPWKTDWKESGSGTGNMTRSLGFGDINLFATRSVKHDGDVTTCELVHTLGPMGVRVTQIKEPSGRTYVSINSFLNDKFGGNTEGKGAREFKQVIGMEAQDAILESINIASAELKANGGVQTRGGKLASAANDWIEIAGKTEDPIAKKKEETQAPAQEQAAVEGESAEEALKL